MITLPFQDTSDLIKRWMTWAGVWLFYVFFFSYNATNISFILIVATTLTMITAVNTYIFLQILIPKFLALKKYLWFSIYSFYLILFTIFTAVMLIIITVALLPEFGFEDLPPLSKNYIFIVVLIILVVFLLSYASLWKNNVIETAKNNQLQKDLLSAQFQAKEQELNYLKHQIHPHFLFNTLNTIYGLSLEKSEKTPTVIMQLSGLLDYILYNTNKPEVSVEDEIEHIENYIALEKVRFEDTLKVAFTKNISVNNAFLPPMLLIPFVENAFKHGKIIDDFLTIDITIDISETHLRFSIKNTYEKGDSKEGIGLKNIKERLSILYGNNYDLQILEDQTWFEVILELDYKQRNSYASN